MAIDDSRPTEERLEPAAKGRIDLAAHVEETALVGGDFYDHFMLGDRHLFFLVADVSGKGAEAAKFMLAVEDALEVGGARHRPRPGCDPGTKPMPRSCARTPPPCSSPAFAACWTWTRARSPMPRPGTPLRFCSATPARPCRSRSTPARRSAWPKTPATRSAAAASRPATGSASSRTASPRRWTHPAPAFGLDRLRATLAETPADADSRAVVAQILARTAAFTGNAEQSDDLTLMVLTMA